MPTENPTTTPCPLARDADGNSLDLPSGAVAWRVRRHTGGRPRIQLGADKQPMQLPLGYTIADVEDILSPGGYRLDLVDQKGEPLGLTIPISIGQLRNDDGDADDTDDHAPAVSSFLPPTGSETRLVLEANVRATQMAFQHNQKTLELGLRMAESLRDGVRVMAESQADWIKSMASARGFFRNAAPPLQLPPAPVKDTDDDEDDDEDDENNYAQNQTDWIEKLMPIVGIVTEKVVGAVMGFGKKSAGGGTKFELADALDWRRVEQKRSAAAAREAAPATTALSELPAIDMASAAHFLAIQSALTPDEATLARAVAAELSPAEVRLWFDDLKQLSVANAVTKIRTMITKPAA